MKMYSDTIPDPTTQQAALAAIAEEIGKDFYAAGLELLQKLTQEERARIMKTTDSEKKPVFAPYRLAKAILVALAEEGRVSRQWSAEGILPDIRRIKRIRKNRP